jgi:hypothetical protein
VRTICQDIAEKDHEWSFLLLGIKGLVFERNRTGSGPFWGRIGGRDKSDIGDKFWVDHLNVARGRLAGLLAPWTSGGGPVLKRGY